MVNPYVNPYQPVDYLNNDDDIPLHDDGDDLSMLGGELYPPNRTNLQRGFWASMY